MQIQAVGQLLYLLVRRREIALAQDRLRLRQHEFIIEQRCIRMRRAPRHAHAVDATDSGRDRQRRNRRAVLRKLVDLVGKDVERHRDFASCHQRGDERVTLADRKARRAPDAPEDLDALLFAHGRDHGRKPVVICRLDRDLADPGRIGKARVARRHRLRFHGLRIIGADDDVEAFAHPFAMGGHRLRQEIGVIG